MSLHDEINELRPEAPLDFPTIEEKYGYVDGFEDARKAAAELALAADARIAELEALLVRVERAADEQWRMLALLEAVVDAALPIACIRYGQPDQRLEVLDRHHGQLCDAIRELPLKDDPAWRK
jgi:hypothetical protein